MECAGGGFPKTKEEILQDKLDAAKHTIERQRIEISDLEKKVEGQKDLQEKVNRLEAQLSDLSERFALLQQQRFS